MPDWVIEGMLIFGAVCGGASTLFFVASFIALATGGNGHSVDMETAEQMLEKKIKKKASTAEAQKV